VGANVLEQAVLRNAPRATRGSEPNPSRSPRSSTPAPSCARAKTMRSRHTQDRKPSLSGVIYELTVILGLVVAYVVLKRLGPARAGSRYPEL